MGVKALSLNSRATHCASGKCKYRKEKVLQCVSKYPVLPERESSLHPPADMRSLILGQFRTFRVIVLIDSLTLLLATQHRRTKLDGSLSTLEPHCARNMRAWLLMFCWARPRGCRWRCGGCAPSGSHRSWTSRCGTRTGPRTTPLQHRRAFRQSLWGIENPPGGGPTLLFLCTTAMRKCLSWPWPPPRNLWPGWTHQIQQHAGS